MTLGPLLTLRKRDKNSSTYVIQHISWRQRLLRWRGSLSFRFFILSVVSSNCADLFSKRCLRLGLFTQCRIVFSTTRSGMSIEQYIVQWRPGVGLGRVNLSMKTRHMVMLMDILSFMISWMRIGVICAALIWLVNYDYAVLRIVL